MNKQEKEQVGLKTSISSFIAIAFIAILYSLMKGYTSIDQKITINFSIIFGQVLIYGGIAAVIFGLIKKNGFVKRYSIESIVYGSLILLMYYFFFKGPGNFGFKYYYSLLLLIGLYIIFSIVITIIRIRK